MIKLFEYNVTDFAGGCLAHLEKAADAAVTKNLQSEYTLSFTYPINDDKAALIQENRIVSVGGQGYRIQNVKRDYDGTRMITVQAAHVFFCDAKNRHIPTIGNDTDASLSTIGCDPYKVVYAALDAADDARFTLIGDDELERLGMHRIGFDGVKIDFMPKDKLNLYDALTAVIEAYGRGEIYVDNYRFAVVERIGKDNNVRLSLGKNVRKLTVERQTSDIITRLYPYGADDLTIGSVTGRAYIDSDDAIARYGIIEGFKDYSDYTDPQLLYDHAAWELMGADNDERMDAPRITITCDVVENASLDGYEGFYGINLGDTVHVYDGDGAVYHKRIITITTYPFDASKMPSVTIGSPSNSDPYNVVRQRGTLLKFVKKNITKRGAVVKARNVTGAVNASTNLRSKSGLLEANADVLTLRDGERLRLRMGIVNGEFVFEIYDKRSNRVMYTDSEGRIITEG